MSWTRREFLIRSALFGAALPMMGALSAGCGEDTDDAPRPRVYETPPEYAWQGPLGPEALFSHGVASGDPLFEAVILWTRVSVEDPQATTSVWWELARDADFTDRILAGTIDATPTRDHCVKVDVTELEPGQSYYYRFFCQGRESATGRTKTAARRDLSQLKMGVASCSNYAAGYFLGYRELAARDDLDVVLHLGDYIYEYGASSGAVRQHAPTHEIITRQDYLTRYAQYRGDADLQAVHQRHPFIIIWDDHESANNAWREGAQNHDSSEGDWADRRSASVSAWLDWMPVREQGGDRIWRRFQFGELVDLLMLDTRLWGRDTQEVPVGGGAEEARTLLGDDQEAWLHAQVASASSRWLVIGQQVMIGQLKTRGRPLMDGGGSYLNPDQWDGYEASRQRLYRAVAQRPSRDLIVLTGDIHTSWAIDLTPDPNNLEVYDPETQAGALGAEFVVPGVTSGGLAGLTTLPPAIEASLTRANPHIRFRELTKRGYMVVTYTREQTRCDWHLFDAVDQPQGASSVAASWAKQHDVSGVREVALS